MRDACAEKPECVKLFQELETCNQRVNSRTKTEEICVQELFDFLECRDKCVSWFSNQFNFSFPVSEIHHYNLEQGTLKSPPLPASSPILTNNASVVHQTEIPPFQTKTAQKPFFWFDIYLYGLDGREVPGTGFYFTYIQK